jgi:hypothetical protein
MSISTPPPPAPQKKRGMGCLGCGCLILVLILILLLGLVVGAGYFGYTKALSLTSTTIGDVPSFNGSDDVYNTAQQKVAGFAHDVENHQAATIQLSADEINTLIARDPDIIRQQAHLFVTFTNDQAQVQGSIPTDAVAQGIIKGRYINFNTTFGVGFNAETKNINLDLHHLQIGDQTTPQNLLPTVQAEFGPFINVQLQKYPTTKNLLQQAKSIQIKDGLLVIETQ